jgi:hypothetical protein
MEIKHTTHLIITTSAFNMPSFLIFKPGKDRGFLFKIGMMKSFTTAENHRLSKIKKALFKQQ